VHLIKKEFTLNLKDSHEIPLVSSSPYKAGFQLAIVVSVKYLASGLTIYRFVSCRLNGGNLEAVRNNQRLQQSAE